MNTNDAMKKYRLVWIWIPLMITVVFATIVDFFLIREVQWLIYEAVLFLIAGIAWKQSKKLKLKANCQETSFPTWVVGWNVPFVTIGLIKFVVMTATAHEWIWFGWLYMGWTWWVLLPVCLFLCFLSGIFYIDFGKRIEGYEE